MNPNPLNFYRGVVTLAQEDAASNLAQNTQSHGHYQLLFVDRFLQDGNRPVSIFQLLHDTGRGLMAIRAELIAHDARSTKLQIEFKPVRLGRQPGRPFSRSDYQLIEQQLVGFCQSVPEGGGGLLDWVKNLLFENDPRKRKRDEHN